MSWTWRLEERGVDKNGKQLYRDPTDGKWYRLVTNITRTASGTQAASAYIEVTPEEQKIFEPEPEPQPDPLPEESYTYEPEPVVYTYENPAITVIDPTPQEIKEVCDSVADDIMANFTLAEAWQRAYGVYPHSIVNEVKRRLQPSVQAIFDARNRESL